MADIDEVAAPASSSRGAPLFDTSTRLGADLAAVDWASTPLGPESTWPASLRNIVRLLLGSRFAMWMAWGPELTFLCNDAYRVSTLGAKYPWALGRPATEVWREIWPDIGPRIDSVITTGVATWDESLMLFLERSGYVEETYHTFSYSPITDDDGVNAGMLCVVTEETSRVLGERRLAALRDLGTALAAASTEQEVCNAAAELVTFDGRDIPFALGYLFDEDGSTARLAWTAGLPPGHACAAPTVDVGDSHAAWPARAVSRGTAETVEDLHTRFADLPTGAWDRPPEQALVVPLIQTEGEQPLGFLVAAFNPYRELDNDSRGFVELLAGQLTAATIRARALDAQRQRAEELAELDRAKTTFFTNVSHELRTPLTLLLGPTADALEDQDAPLPAAQRDRLQVIGRNAERLLQLVNTLLDFSRLSAGSAQPHFESVDLARYTGELAAMFDSAVRRAGLGFEVQVPQSPVEIVVDREMWAKIVLNLISNALKATFTGKITVRLSHEGEHVVLAVTDTGVGIPEPEQRRLFERFHRVAGAALRSHEGSGIGLALVAELVELHGGTVGVESTPGAGSTFSVRMPAQHEHTTQGNPAESAPTRDFVRGISAGYLAEVDRWLTAVDDASEPPSLENRPRILVVDDNADMRSYIAGLLQHDYVVDTAVDGVDALAQVRTAEPALVLTDVMMPRLDGFGLLAELRADPRTVHIPVVMLSARAGDEATVEGLDAGADDYLAKPFSARELVARIRANLELDRVRRLADELARSRGLLDQAEALAHVGSWELDLDDMGITASPEFFRLLGVAPEDIAAGGLELALQSVHAADRDAVVAALERMQRTGEPLDLELRIEHPVGGQRLIHARGVVQRDARGNAVSLRGSALDITDQREAERAVVASVAAREAAAREHAIADELQRSLLPATAVRAPGLDVAAYYVAGTRDTQAGGDWYDVIELPAGRVALVIGDVMGRGVHAAAIMGQLRASVRAYARLDLEPAQVLRLLDQAVAEMSEPTIVTCIYAVYDPAQGALTYGSAGHLPPFLTPPGGTARPLGVGDPPLGTRSYSGRTETVEFPAGARLLLYTDGLVEHRGSDIDVGIDALAAFLDRSPEPVEALLTDAVDALLGGSEPDDDVAMLAVVARHSEEQPLAIALPTHASSPATARRTVRQALDGWQVDQDRIADIVLATSELVTNAVMHGRSPVELLLRADESAVILQVSDGALARPVERDAALDASNGRGLRLVRSVAERFGMRPTGAGKAVWAVFRRAPDQSSTAPDGAPAQ